jgi:Ca2+-binding EF-hand superfamily protein
MKMKHSFLMLAMATAFSTSALAVEFNDLDINADGKLTQDELNTYRGVVQNWSDVDTNEDGTLDLNEFTVLVEDPTLSEKTGWQAGSDTNTDSGPAVAQPAEEKDIFEEFSLLDVNQDNNLSQAELEQHAGMIQYWGDIDTNQDSYIDRDEFTSMSNNKDLSEKTGWQSGSTAGPGDAKPAQN